MLDEELARLYGIETKYLVRAVKRNGARFPTDFAFQLHNQEVGALRCQIGTSNEGRGGRRYRPYVFTEHGILMLSSVLNSERAVKVNIEIMRAFVKMREGSRYDAQFKVVFNSIRELISSKPKTPPAAAGRRKIGFGRE